MPPRIENYQGREQSFIMHLFLNKYLESAAYKLFQGRSPVFNFVDAFAGPSRNTMGDWTRINPSSGRVTRSFGGASDSGFAWNVGAGVAWDVGPVLGSAPAKLELAWRYFELGSVSGSTNALSGNGSGGTPIEALNFDVTDQVFSVGLRFPL